MAIINIKKVIIPEICRNPLLRFKLAAASRRPRTTNHYINHRAQTRRAHSARSIFASRYLSRRNDTRNLSSWNNPTTRGTRYIKSRVRARESRLMLCQIATHLRRVCFIFCLTKFALEWRIFWRRCAHLFRSAGARRVDRHVVCGL